MKKSEAHEAFGKAVRVHRARLGLSQEGLGLRAGMHRNYVGAIERGEINLTLTTLITLSRGMGLSPSRLLRLSEEQAAFNRGGVGL